MDWASSSSSINSQTDDSEIELRDFLFFLHVPRTGGRTYGRCLLHKMNLNSEGCMTSYDEFRFDPSRGTNCRLISSHDDYSVMSKLPGERTSVMTIMRNPIERVFGTYEFSLELSSRFIKLDNIKAARGRGGKVTRSGIWPWKYLAPWMEADLLARKDARERRGQVHLTTENNPYDMEDFSMPLRDYVYEPIVRDLVHNGATFQIAGLTNYSIFEKAHEVRQCVIKYQDLGQYVLDIAKKRLDDMFFVGLTEKHRESALMLAKIMVPKVLSRNETWSSPSRPRITEKNSFLFQDTEPIANLTVASLIEAYESCASSSRKSQSGWWAICLKELYNANITYETRRLVPDEIIEEIASLNSLDVELYHYAQQIFIKQQHRRASEIESIGSTTIFGQPMNILAVLLVLKVIAGLLLCIGVRRSMSSKLKL